MLKSPSNLKLLSYVVHLANPFIPGFVVTRTITVITKITKPESKPVEGTQHPQKQSGLLSPSQHSSQSVTQFLHYGSSDI